MVINRWLILGVLFVARFALGFQFQSVGSATPFVVEDFGVDYTNIGLLVGLYILPGLFLSVPSGFAGRRFGDKRIVLAGLMLMLAGGVVAGAAERYATVVVGRLMSGAGAASRISTKAPATSPLPAHSVAVSLVSTSPWVTWTACAAM